MPADPMVGRLVDGRYQVRSRIARGGMATVYLATDLRLERRVAIKIMHGHLADDNTFKTRFVQEARSAARLSHPNVVNVYDQGQDSDMAYLVMEYLPGITLRDLLRDYTKLTPEQSVDIMDAVLSGLASAHKAGIVHRDLKPENVLLADDGRIKLGDFGLARAASANTSTGQALLGTIAYLSPELVTRGVADARSDIYAVGILLYEMLTGEQPYVGEAPMQIAYQHANDTVPTPSSKEPSVPAELDELVLWATARDPEERPADARAMLEQLRAIEPVVRGTGTATGQATAVIPDGAGTGVPDSTAATTVLGERRAAVAAPRKKPAASGVAALEDQTRRRKRRGYWLFALVLLLAGLAGGTGWYFGSGPGALTTVPTVSGLSPEAAAAALADAGFESALGEQHDPEIEEGLVSGTDPEGGTEARRGGTVQILVSLGPRILAVPDVTGMQEDDARDALADFDVAEETDVRYSDVDRGGVIAVLDADGERVGAEYPEQGALSLVVSAGGIPSVVGTPSAEAEQRLADAGLDVSFAEAQFSNDVAADLVLSAATSTDPVRPGDPIVLTVSKGPDLVPLPDVVGENLADAIDTLEAAGFDVQYSFPEAFVGLATVKSMSPGGGTEQIRNSTVTLVATLEL
ncbi:Stk1 family PASTA domain-containing Ser/Thr kinase [Agromyces mangrovi Wang et al. 2018]|uniref:Stk1 family PASTA domain-containing Ser/Thr kinase n=1 Tax=Agromyces mangrovi TaxID=1858653 RepID=UPI00257399C8|nr:Stk1 family PASTA domain-containing Ser/Thr kinase [Agromyces mangrovi]BDZ66200.1 serine/threonine protein kinase [Agromyces mangrovi]